MDHLHPSWWYRQITEAEEDAKRWLAAWLRRLRGESPDEGRA
jgi:hypothetical protein